MSEGEKGEKGREREREGERERELGEKKGRRVINYPVVFIPTA